MNYRTRITQIATCLAFAIVLLDTSVVNVAIAAIRLSLHTDMRGIQWIINSYSLTFSALLLTAGVLGDRFGCKPVFLAGFALFTFGSLCCGLSQTAGTLIASRIIQGAGAALLVPASLSLIHILFREDAERGKAIGWWGAAGGIALAAGPVAGGWLVTWQGWPSVFLLNVPAGIIGLLIVARYAPPSVPRPGKHPDIAGQLTVIITAGSLAYGLITAGHDGWASHSVLSSLTVSVVCAALFIVVERRHPDPMLPLSLFRQVTLRTSTLVGFIANLAFYGMIFVLSLYFQTVLHYSVQQAGSAFLPMMAILVVMNILAGRIMPKVGVKRLAVYGLLISAGGYGWLISAGPQTTPLAMLLAGSGIALAIPAITSAALDSVAPGQTGIAGGLLNAARQAGGVFGVALFGTLINSYNPVQFTHGMHTALAISAGLLLFAAGISGLWLKHRHKDRKNQHLPA